jgi:hypothetical protein
VNFHGEKRSNQTHQSTSDSEALLARKGGGKEAKLSYNGNLLTENRNGLIVNIDLLQAHGTRRAGRCPGYAGASSRWASGHLLCRQRVRYPGFRGRVPQCICDATCCAEHDSTGWQRHRCANNAAWVFTFGAAAYNLVRMPKLLASPAGAR